MPGDYGGGVIPVPIPNTEVKPSNADDTASLRGGKVGHCQAFFILNPPCAGFFIYKQQIVSILFSLYHKRVENQKHFFVSVSILAVLICISCASTETPKTGQTPLLHTPSLLPLSEGWYKSDFERTFKAVEDEYNFEKNMGMKMIFEHTWKCTEVVCRFDEGVLYDPMLELELLVDSEGRISSRDNVSVNGSIGEDGRFFWSAVMEVHGRLHNIFVKGILTPLPLSARGGREFDGVYSLVDEGTGRKQLAKISEGFYTWQYIDGEEAGFSPWPTLIKKDGSFGFSINITTVAEMGSISNTNFTTGFVSSGRVIPGQGIVREEFSRTTGTVHDQWEAPQVFAGTMIKSGEYPNEAIPPDIESLVQSGRAAIKALPKPNLSDYPAWYLKLPVKSGVIYAAGEKSFEVKETAFAMAEASAAAGIAEQFRVQIEGQIIDAANDRGSFIEERLKSDSFQRLNYRIVERHYNDKTQTAFVLAELDLE